MSRSAMILYVGKDPKVSSTFKDIDVSVLSETDFSNINYSRVANALPDIAVIDYPSTSKDGLGVFKKLRDLQPESFLPIVFLTEETSALFRAKCMDLGADEVLSKPVNTIEFLAAVRSSLRKRSEFLQLHQKLQHYRDQLETLHLTNNVSKRQKVDLADDLLRAEQVKQFFRNINLLDLRKVYQRIREQLPALLEVEMFSLFVYNPDKGTLELAVHNHPNLKDRLVLQPDAGGMLFDAVHEHESMVIDNAGARSGHSGKREKYKHTDALIIPLRVGEEIIGVLNVNNSLKGRFTEQDRMLADQIAQFLSTIVCNARLYEKVRALSTLDGLTGLLNHLNIHKRLYIELLRALRYSRPLTCIMMDLDHFKLINDTYGHPAGDKILKDVTEVIQANLREVDVPARYGGEEFFIILPETGIEEARRIAERIREAIASKSFSVDGYVIPVTASFGIASFPQAKIMHKNQLVRHADQALYDAKKAGRNRVASYQERRVAQRYKVDMDIKYVTEEVKTVRAALMNNISSTGASVATSEPMAPGTTVWLELKMSDGAIGLNGGSAEAKLASAFTNGEIKARGEVVWCRASGSVSGMYEIGIQFQNLDEDKRKTLSKIVYGAIFKDVSQSFTAQPNA